MCHDYLDSALSKSLYKQKKKKKEEDVFLTVGGKSSRLHAGRLFVLKINSSESLRGFKAFVKLNPNA